MSFKLFIFCATLAIARAGYLQPAVRYAHAAPVAISAPAALTYSIPPTVRAEHLPPVVTTSYGYSSAHTPVPAPIIRAEPVHVAPAPVALAAPVVHSAPALGFASHFGGSHLGFERNYAAGFGFSGPLNVGHGFAAPAIHAAPIARVSLPAPVALAAPAVHAAPALGFASHFGGSHLGFERNYAAGFGFSGPLNVGHGFAAPAIHAAPIARVAVPAPVALAAPAVHAAPTLGFANHFGGSHLGFARNYAAGFGIGSPLNIGHGFAASAIRAAPVPISFGSHFGPAPLAHSSYGNHF